MKRVAIGAALACVLALGACSDREQTLTQGQRQGSSTSKPAYDGTGSPFQASGWKAGDRGSWEQQLKVRTQMGQNDYNKVQ